MVVIFLGAALAASATGWDKVAAVSGVIAASIALMLAATTAYHFIRGRWANWLRMHTFKLTPIGGICAGTGCKDMLEVVALRPARILNIDLRVTYVKPKDSFYRSSDYQMNPDIAKVSLTDSAAVTGPLPRYIKRGEVFKFPITMEIMQSQPHTYLVLSALADVHSPQGHYITYQQLPMVGSVGD